MEVPSDGVKDRQSGLIETLEDQCRLIQIQLDGLASEYEEFADTWKVIDTKAQTTAAVTGVFLGGIFAVQRIPTLGMPIVDRYLLGLALLLLGVSILCAMIALWLRDIFFAPRGIKSSEIFEKLYSTEEFQAGGVGLLERVKRHKQEQVRLWIEVNASTLRIITLKGKWTLAAQALFVSGALVFVALSLYGMFHESTFAEGV